MARSEARIKADIWRDKDWRRLPPNSKLLYLTILSQPTISYCGTIGYAPEPWGDLTGLSAKAMKGAVDALEQQRYILVDRPEWELWVRSFVKNDGVLEKPFLIVAMTKDYQTIRSDYLRAHFLESLGERFLEWLPEQFPKVFQDKFPTGFGKSFLDDYQEHFSRAHDARVPHSPLPVSPSSLPPDEVTPVDNLDAVSDPAEPPPMSEQERQAQLAAHGVPLIGKRVEDLA